jgi:hypothetical protein
VKTIGIVGGLAWPSTVIYYRTINELVASRLGGLHCARLVLAQTDFDQVERYQRAGLAVAADAAAGLDDSPGNTRAEPGWPGPRRPVVAASTASRSSLAAWLTPESSAPVSSSCHGGGAQDSGSQYSCGSSNGSSSCSHSQSSHASRSAAVIGSRSSQAGSPSRPGSPGAGTEGMNHIRSAEGLFFEYDTANSPRSPVLSIHFE